MKKRERPKRLVGNTTKVATGCGNVYITITRDKEGIFEVFATLGKAGGCTMAILEGLSRSITLGLRCGVPAEEYVKQLEHIQCHKAMWNEGEMVLSCVDAIATVLKQENHNEKTGNVSAVAEPPKPAQSASVIQKQPEPTQVITTVAGVCPECQRQLAFQEGCELCPSCGWSECS